MTIDELTKLMGHVSELAMHFDRMNTSPEAIKSWVKFLADLEFDDAVAAMREHIKYDEKTPTVAAIRKRAVAIRDERKKQAKRVRIGNITYDSPPDFEREKQQREEAGRYLAKRAAQQQLAIPVPIVDTPEQAAKREAYRQQTLDIMRRKAEGK